MEKNRVDVNSPWFPYIKVQEGYYDLKDTVSLPRKICNYLIDAPQGSYAPKNNNDLPRVRLWKYLYYDVPRPLEQSLPTIQQKMSVVFDPENPEDPPTDKGYRLIPQIYVPQAQLSAQTRLYVYLGRTVPMNEEARIAIAVTFRIWTHYTYESNTKTDEYSRAFAIEQALIEALHGVNMTGVGTFSFSKYLHPDCGSNVMFDGQMNVGRELTMALLVATSQNEEFGDVVNMPMVDPKNPNIRWG